MKQFFKVIGIVIGVMTVTLLFFLGKIYYDLSTSVNKMYANAMTESGEIATKFVNLEQKQPFSLLLLGIDSEDLTTEYGRSDSLSLLTINPGKKQTKLLSIPRDAYVEIDGREGKDKINHAYAYGGASMAIKTVEGVFDLPINHYVTLDMVGLKKLVDIVGGIAVESPFDFTYQGKKFTKGINFLNGEEALKYSRMRKDDPLGDYGRQERQRQVIESIGKKLFNLKMLPHYQEVLSTLENNMRTDFTFLDMKSIALNYGDVLSNIDSLQLEGENYEENGISYQKITDEQLKMKQNLLKENLE
ncbi:LCP family glycopolymer transferase [Enterococcus villorum]|uniref:Transcriptional regulator n=2 Tax=Enterococcus villorum TaxID=112904 RepID=A0A511J508_9ENTE|nr:LCP family protein [Enterococcus villorum]EOH92019.1 hypothetical protein UAO_00690 [Enterococcus villorum ATCC 700913]EOW76735.1 hypothetical protein I591_02043 [Enterococcus villorum ATCC 700913]GEL93051.1 transcriptional regulator [Enterococcus villorum]